MIVFDFVFSVGVAVALSIELLLAGIPLAIPVAAAAWTAVLPGYAVGDSR